MNLVQHNYHKVSQQVHPAWVGKGDKEDAMPSTASSSSEKSIPFYVTKTRQQCTTSREQWTRNPLCSAKPRTRRHIKGDIQAFEKIDKGPEDELADIKQAYLNCKGDTDQLTESVLCVQRRSLE